MASVVKFQYHIFRIPVNEEPQFIKHWAEVRLIYKHFPFRTQLWSQLTFPAGSKMMWNFYGYRTKDMKWSFLDWETKDLKLMSSGSDTHDWLIIPGKKQKGTPRHGTIQFVKRYPIPFAILKKPHKEVIDLTGGERSPPVNSIIDLTG